MHEPRISGGLNCNEPSKILTLASQNDLEWVAAVCGPQFGRVTVLETKKGSRYTQCCMNVEVYNI